MQDDFQGQAEFYIVYIAEAHTIDGWQMESNEKEGIRIAQPTVFPERMAAAKRCATDLRLRIPTLVDGMDNAAYEAFSAWPERIYIIDSNNHVHYRGGPGPFEFNVDEARASLSSLLRV